MSNPIENPLQKINEENIKPENKQEEQLEKLTEEEIKEFNEDLEELKPLIEDEVEQLATEDTENNEEATAEEPRKSLEKEPRMKRFKKTMLAISVGAAIMAGSLAGQSEARAGNFFEELGKMAQTMNEATRDVRKYRRSTERSLEEFGKIQELLGLKETNRQQRYREQAERYAIQTERYIRDAEREAKRADYATQRIEDTSSERDARRFENDKKRSVRNIERMADRAEKSADRAMDYARKANSEGGNIAANRAAMAAQQVRAIADRVTW